MVDLTFDVTGFTCRLATVHHNSSITTSIDDYTDRPVSVFYFAASQHHILFVYLLSNCQLL